jgi:hypothetical protein
MALKGLRETVRLRLLEKGATRNVIETYFSRWDGALDPEGGAPLPCPDCYLGGAISRLRRMPSPAGVGIVKCPSCSATFEFPDFEPVAAKQGTWPTRA